MQIQVNGETRIVRDGVTVADLLRELEIPDERVAVEVNLSIIERGDYGRQRLCEGDRVEILSFIGGGGSSTPFPSVPSTPAMPISSARGGRDHG